MIKKDMIEKRKNPEYSPEHCFTVRECEKCGELYEPFCKLNHICKRQNSYPKEQKDETDIKI